MIGLLKQSGGLHIQVDQCNVPWEQLSVECSPIWGMGSDGVAADSTILDGTELRISGSTCSSCSSNGVDQSY